MASRTFQAVTTALSRVTTSLETVARTARECHGVLDGLVERAATTTGAVQAMAKDVESTVATAQQSLHGLDAVLSPMATRVDDVSEMIDRAAAAGNAWAKELQLQMEAVRLGAIQLDEFIRMFGEASITTEDGLQTIRELMGDVPWDEYSDRIQELTQGLREGVITVDEVVGHLAKNSKVLASSLKDVFDQYREGGVTLQRLAEVISQLQRQFEGSDLDVLLDAILDALRKGEL